MKNHAPNCDCYDCTSNDPYLTKLRQNFMGGALPARHAVYGSSRNHFGELSIMDVQTKTLNQVPIQNTTVAAPKASIKDILGDALGNIVGDLMQAKKEGQTLPKALDAVASLGIKTEQAGYKAAQESAAQSVGQNVLKFSPMILAVIVGVVGLLLFLMFKK